MNNPSTALEKRLLGERSGLHVAVAGLGLWAVTGSQWGPGDDDASLAAIDAALDAGVNFFDTADVYGGGRSEELLGRAMTGRRDRFIAASKIGWVGYNGEKNRSQYDTTAKLTEGVEASLRRLRTDYLDVIQCHIFYAEPNTPVFIEGFRKLKESGKVRAWGVSTGDFSLLETFNAAGDCDVLQIDYSILNREPEREIFPYCQKHGIGVIVRGPLAMGLLAGKFTANSTFPEDDFRSAWISDAAQNAQFHADLDTVERLKAIPRGRANLPQFALRFVIDQPAVSVVIPGARNPAQARQNTAAAGMSPLADDELARIDALVPSGGGRKIWPA